jgi:hypothetical protein
MRPLRVCEGWIGQERRSCPMLRTDRGVLAIQSQALRRARRRCTISSGAEAVPAPTNRPFYTPRFFRHGRRAEGRSGKEWSGPFLPTAAASTIKASVTLLTFERGGRDLLQQTYMNEYDAAEPSARHASSFLAASSVSSRRARRLSFGSEDRVTRPAPSRSLIHRSAVVGGTPEPAQALVT